MALRPPPSPKPTRRCRLVQHPPRWSQCAGPRSRARWTCGRSSLAGRGRPGNRPSWLVPARRSTGCGRRSPSRPWPCICTRETALGLTTGRVPTWVDARVRASLFDLVQHALGHGWSTRRACRLLDLSESRVGRWATRDIQHGAEGLPDPGGQALYGLVAPRARRSRRYDCSSVGRCSARGPCRPQHHKTPGQRPHQPTLPRPCGSTGAAAHSTHLIRARLEKASSCCTSAGYHRECWLVWAME